MRKVFFAAMRVVEYACICTMSLFCIVYSLVVGLPKLATLTIIIVCVCVFTLFLCRAIK